jgi:two-component system, chemotaxis family, protein-glutamate methylesterase/glutaminase
MSAIVIGGSAGAMDALLAILSALPSDFALPILVVQHLHATDGGRFARYVGEMVSLHVVEPCDKEPIRSACVYVAPANYHMLVEKDGTIALSVDERVNCSRPSIDVLFESAARAWGEALVVVILSGASDDGARGMRVVRALGGLTIAQDPATAEHPLMPQAAIGAGVVDEVLSAAAIGQRLMELAIGNCRLPIESSEIRGSAVGSLFNRKSQIGDRK